MAKTQDVQPTQSSSQAIGRTIVSSCVQGAIGGALFPGAGIVSGCLTGLAVQTLISTIAPSTAK